ncbi:MAG: hypothetical protein WCD35_15665, partial [Mycobacteriales bacterium]
ELTDVVMAESCEIYLYSSRFRATVDARRVDADAYDWLPVTLQDRLGQNHEYWILNVRSPDAAGTYGITAALAAGRSVVLHRIGASQPAFAETTKQALERACAGLRFSPAS